MSIWKDKNGLHQQISDPTIVEETLAELNKLEEETSRMTFDELIHTREYRSTRAVDLRIKMRWEQGVSVEYDFQQRRTRLSH